MAREGYRGVSKQGRHAAAVSKDRGVWQVTILPALRGGGGGGASLGGETRTRIIC